MFRTPVSPNMTLLDHHANIIGAENRAMCAFRATNYEVLNPCVCFLTYHLHCSKKRSVNAQMNHSIDWRQECPSNDGRNFRTPEVCSLHLSVSYFLSLSL